MLHVNNGSRIRSYQCYVVQRWWDMETNPYGMEKDLIPYHKKKKNAIEK